jgi:hypothetical protein
MPCLRGILNQDVFFAAPDPAIQYNRKQVIKMKNISSPDQLARIFLGVVLLELAAFWLPQAWQAATGIVGLILLGTGLMRFCPLYRLLGINKNAALGKPLGKPALAIALLLLGSLVVGGSYASAFFTRKLFLEDFNVMNNYYKQTLFLTGKNEREKAAANYDRLIPEYQRFQAKYTSYRPYALRGDDKLGVDLASAEKMISAVSVLVKTGDLHQAHLDLEKVRPVFQEIFKRNGFSMLAVALVDFHDAMELVLDAANAKDDAKLTALYPAVSDLLKVVEAEANDAEIQTIRKNLDDLLALATAKTFDKMPAKGDELKTSFVKVYLKRG